MSVHASVRLAIPVHLVSRRGVNDPAIQREHLDANRLHFEKTILDY